MVSCGLIMPVAWSHHIVNGRYFNSGGKKSGQFHELVFGVDFSHLSSIMRLPFLARRLDEIAFGPVWSLVRVPPIANSLPEEMPVYKQMKIRFTIYVHLKVPHDTPPLRGFQPLVSLILDFRVSRSSNLVFHKPGF
jgi:hypothetical protein